MISIIKKFFNYKKFDPSNKKELGDYGEQLAADFLKQKKYKIIERNWRHKNDEIDIICFEEAILVFVEVRLRNSNALVNGYYSITKHKRIALRRAIDAFIASYYPDIVTYRLDVIDISLDKKTMGYEILHFENV